MVNIFNTRPVRFTAMVFSLFIVFLLAETQTALAANIVVQVDRNPVSIDESFRIIFETDDNISSIPDFSPLQQDFEILNRSQSSNMQFINGNLNQQTRWTLLVMAKRSGKLTIPAIQIGNTTSPAKQITVNKGSSSNTAVPENSNLFIETKVDLASVYVQQQVLFTVRFYRAININGASMSEPDFSGADVIMEKLGDDSSFETQRHGRRYAVVERKYALFPQKSGELMIQPITIDVKIPATRRGVFDPFGQNSTTKRLKSKSISVDVKPVPVDLNNAAWLPTTSLQLTESWSQNPPEFVAGEPVTRTLTLKGEGLTAAQLPALEMGANDNIRAYPDQPRLNNKYGSRGISGTRQEKIALIPNQAGTLTLPAIEIKWWNTERKRMETASLSARTFQVSPGQNTNPSSTHPPDTASGNTTSLPTDIAASWQQSDFYIKLSFFLGLGWLLTAIGWLIYTRRHTDSAHTQQVVNTTNSQPCSPGKIKKACLANDPQQAKTELLNWAQGHWPDDPPANLHQIGIRLNADVLQEIERLNLALYGADETTWQGKELWQAFNNTAKTRQPGNTRNNSPLLPLYP